MLALKILLVCILATAVLAQSCRHDEECQYPCSSQRYGCRRSHHGYPRGGKCRCGSCAGGWPGQNPGGNPGGQIPEGYPGK